MTDHQGEIHNEGQMNDDAALDMLATVAVLALVVGAAVFWVAGL